MRVWVTRTRPLAERTAARLMALGHEPVVAPVLEVRTCQGETLNLTGVAAIAFTSQNGVQAFARLSADRTLPAFTTGEATAEAARAAGFSDVQSAAGDAVALARLIAEASPPSLLWVAPRDPARDLAALLARTGVTVRRADLYETVASEVATPQADAVLIHSPRAAAEVARRIDAAQAAALRVYAISPAAMAPLERLGFLHVAVAPRPDETELLGLLAP